MKKAILLSVVIFVFLSCSRSGGSAFPPQFINQGALPAAILQTGEHPIWFQLTENGPVHIESIEDAVMSAAFVPWPFALHVRFYNEKDDKLIMAINRDGFVKITPSDTGLALYHFSGGAMWKQYTIGGFFNYNDQDTALLYIDDRFLSSSAPIPNPRTWTIDMEFNSIVPLGIPALELYPASEGWDIDTLRQSSDGYWYYRVSKLKTLQPEIFYLRTENLAQAGIVISVEDFFSSAPQEKIIKHPSLPLLPEGFVYTALAHVGDSLFVSWEEQDAFNIGAAGFMLIKK
ncbi:MAG: hypothetical protein LBU88_06545 [Treponema sp.]|jgi:hypothetical protein|nr:hypothetical protein [Treponema sp.]